MRSTAMLTVAPAGSGRWVVSGELDAATVPALRKAVVGGSTDVELNCHGVTFLDAAGVNLFVGLQLRYQTQGTSLTIVDPSPPVVRLLALTGVDTFVHVRSEQSLA